MSEKLIQGRNAGLQLHRPVSLLLPPLKSYPHPSLWNGEFLYPVGDQKETTWEKNRRNATRFERRIWLESSTKPLVFIIINFSIWIVVVKSQAFSQNLVKLTTQRQGRYSAGALQYSCTCCLPLVPLLIGQCPCPPDVKPLNITPTQRIKWPCFLWAYLGIFNKQQP